jgi:hypothetical protein
VLCLKPALKNGALLFDNTLRIPGVFMQSGSTGIQFDIVPELHDPSVIMPEMHVPSDIMSELHDPLEIMPELQNPDLPVQITHGFQPIRTSVVYQAQSIFPIAETRIGRQSLPRVTNIVTSAAVN